MIVPELDLKRSKIKVRDLEKAKKVFSNKDLVPGNLLFISYNAKDKTKTFDRKPMILLLKISKTHVLGLNFHWLPYKMRIDLIKIILKENKSRIKEGKKIRFYYNKIKAFLKQNFYVPCIRVYVKNRILKSGTVIPPERLVEVARLKTESFSGISSKKLFRIMKNGYRNNKSR